MTIAGYVTKDWMDSNVERGMKMGNIKVYKMNDYEWWASKLDKRATLDFYLKETGLDEGDNPIEDIRECDIDKEGMWWETDELEDIERLGEADEILGTEKINGMTKRKIQPGNLMRLDGGVYKFISFRDAIQKHGKYEEPYEIGSTEW